MTKDEKEEGIATTAIEGIATTAIDSEKYFDGICWEVTFQMLNRIDLDQRIWKPMILHCTPQEIQQGCGNAGAHVELHEQHHTGMLPESAGNSGAIDGLGKSLGGRSTYSLLQQHCGRPAPKQLQSAIQITSDFDGATGTRFNPPVRHRQSRWRRKCSKPRSSLG